MTGVLLIHRTMDHSTPKTSYFVE